MAETLRPQPEDPQEKAYRLRAELMARTRHALGLDPISIDELVSGLKLSDELVKNLISLHTRVTPKPSDTDWNDMRATLEGRGPGKKQGFSDTVRGMKDRSPEQKSPKGR